MSGFACIMVFSVGFILGSCVSISNEFFRLCVGNAKISCKNLMGGEKDADKGTID